MAISIIEKILMVITSLIVLFIILLVYITQHVDERHLQNCRFYAQGAADIVTKQQLDNNAENISSNNSVMIMIPSEFMSQYLLGYANDSNYAQSYYQAYQTCLNEYGF